MSQSPLSSIPIKAKHVPEVTSTGEFCSRAEHNLDISLGDENACTSTGAQIHSTENHHYKFCLWDFCAVFLLCPSDLVHIYIHLSTYTLPQRGWGRHSRLADSCACWVFTYSPVETDRQTVVDRTTDKFIEIWLQKPGGLWPGPACSLFFLPNKRIRRINAHKYLWA